MPDQITTPPLPELKGELLEILGRMPMNNAGIARRLHELGLYVVPRRIEEEQAAALHWMLNMYFKHGDQWRAEGEKILKDEK